MRFQILSLAALLASNGVNAVKVHVDVDVELAERRHLSQSSTDDEKKFIIDLPHGKHQGFPSDDGSYIKWSNIPYARPPAGENFRWRRPIEPEYTPDTVFDGKGKSKCAQADGTGSEDCLYLDVYVPKVVWDKRDASGMPPSTAIYFHGGGFVSGSKDDFKKPDGLFKAALLDGRSESFILVAPNYRLGIFGWLGGAKYRKDYGTASLGILDQKAAIEWVSNEIRKFGGIDLRVQLVGQEAGAASVLHHLTFASGDQFRYKPRFQGVMLHSPLFTPRIDDATLDRKYQDVLKAANATNLYTLAQVNTADLLQINKAQGGFGLGPSYGSEDTQDVPATMIRDGRFFKNIPVYAGYARLEPLTTKCNIHYLSNAINKASSPASYIHRYVFGAHPPYTGGDLNYIFYPEKVQGDWPPSSKLAAKYQGHWVNRVRFWDPNDNPKDEKWPEYTSTTTKVFIYGGIDSDATWGLRNDPMSAAEKKQCDDLNTSAYPVKFSEQQMHPSFYSQRPGRGARHLEM